MKQLTNEERKDVEKYPRFDWDLYDLMEEKNENSCIGCTVYNGQFKVQYCVPAFCEIHLAMWLTDRKRFEREYWNQERDKEHLNDYKR